MRMPNQPHSLCLVLVLLLGSIGSVFSAGLCDEYPCCYMENSTNGCSITNMPTSPSTLVLPGGETRCIYSGAGPYAFQVWPGSPSRLAINFQGGGACWDKSSTKPAFCTVTVTPEPEYGAFNRQNEDNEFSKFTIVYINYCSGDMHAGNTVRSYNDPTGNPVQQTGIANVESVLTWIENQQKMGGLATTFDDFVVMGDSAGAIATQVWSSALLERFSYKKAAIIPDSYIGVFPKNTQGPLIYNFGACTKALFDDALYQKCMNQELTLQDIVIDTLPKYPEIPFSFLQSKVDSVQMSFYVALAVSLGKNPVLSQGKFYNLSNAIMESYNTYPNFVVYLVDGGHHTFTPMSQYYTAGPHGPREEFSLKDPMLYQWVNTVPFETPNPSISSVCESKGGKNDYCSPEVYPKTYTPNKTTK